MPLMSDTGPVYSRDELRARDLMRALVATPGAPPARVILDVRDEGAVVYAALVVRPDAVDPLIALMHGMPVDVMTGGSAEPASRLGDERTQVLALLAEMDEDAGVMEQSGDKRGQTVRGYAGRLRAALGAEREEVGEDED